MPIREGIQLAGCLLRRQLLINAVTAEVDLGAGNFTGYPTYQDLAGSVYA